MVLFEKARIIDQSKKIDKWTDLCFSEGIKRVSMEPQEDLQPLQVFELNLSFHNLQTDEPDRHATHNIFIILICVCIYKGQWDNLGRSYSMHRWLSAGVL